VTTALFILLWSNAVCIQRTARPQLPVPNRITFRVALFSRRLECNAPFETPEAGAYWGDPNSKLACSAANESGRPARDELHDGAPASDTSLRRTGAAQSVGKWRAAISIAPPVMVGHHRRLNGIVGEM